MQAKKVNFMQAKFMLLLAIVLEISGTALMKYFLDKDLSLIHI